MRRAATWLIVVVFLAASAAVLAQNARPAAAPQGVRWEYGNLFYSRVTGDWNWLSPGVSVSGDKARIYKALGGASPREPFPIDLVNQAGQHGWDMVDGTPDADSPSNFWFKRLAR